MIQDSPVELSIILPAYNEGKAVGEVAERYVAALCRLNCSFEIVVVNDGSTDDTLAQAQKAESLHPQIRLVDNGRNLGQVGSILNGFAHAHGRIFMTNAVDLPFDPDHTARVLQLLHQGADVVVVERSDRKAYGVARKFLSWANIVLIKILLRSPFKDHNFVQAYRREVTDAITVESSGVSTVTPELILKALALGFRVVSIQAPYLARRTGQSTITWRKTVHTTLQLFQLARILRRFRRAQKRSPPPA